MRSDELARLLASRIARRQSRGLVDDAMGLADVVVHGRVDLIAVADDLIAAWPARSTPDRRSWAGWFEAEVQGRAAERRRRHARAKLAAQIESEPGEARVAIARLRLRGLDQEP